MKDIYIAPHFRREVNRKIVILARSFVGGGGSSGGEVGLLNFCHVEHRIKPDFHEFPMTMKGLASLSMFSEEKIDFFITSEDAGVTELPKAMK